MKQGFVYIVASATRTIYTGVTNDLGRRVWEHKNGVGIAFTTRYMVTRLVWFAEFERMDDAIAWEKALKGKTRAKKMALIEERNPRWNDLAWDWFRVARRSQSAQRMPCAVPGTRARCPAAPDVLRTGILNRRFRRNRADAAHSFGQDDGQVSG